ncbi:MAG: Ig-like domain-containing protein [Salibacteraceae bacterium]
MTGLASKYFKIGLLCLVISILCASCAQQVPPQGGEVDRDSPRIVTSIPRNEAVNVNEQEIMFEFDEYIQLKGANQQLIVSPPLKYPVEFKIKGKKLYVSWRDTLAENTTYLYQFGEGIVDVNEGNILDSNIFVFSTGPYLDSFSLQGKVIDALTMDPVEDVWVMLYVEDIDSLPYLELPRYFAKTDQTGQFNLQYLSQGEYKVFALLEEGSGYLYDLPTESIGFLEGMIPVTHPSDTTGGDTTYTIDLFLQNDSTQYLLGNTQLGMTGIQLQFNAPVETIEIQELTGLANVAEWTDVWNAFNDTVTYWFPSLLAYDSLKLRIAVEGYTDTLFLRKPKESRGKRKMGSKKSEENAIELRAGGRGSQRHFKPWRLRSNTPIALVKDLSEALFIEGKDSMELAPYFTYDKSEITVDYDWKQGTKYKIFIPDSIIFDRFNASHDTLEFSFITSRKEDFGQLEISHNLPDNGHAYIWQLLLDDDVVDERLVQPKGKINYPYLATGTYKVKLLFDENNNGIWDTGFYLGKRQPEEVTYFNEKIEIRSNWATEMEWNLVLP